MHIVSSIGRSRFNNENFLKEKDIRERFLRSTMMSLAFSTSIIVRRQEADDCYQPGGRLKTVEERT